MLRAAWNALDAGDNVLVHHTAGGQPQLIPGVVVSVVAVSGTNDVGIHLAGSPRQQLVHPGRLVVHHDPIELDGSCWRCTTVHPPQAGPRGG